MSTDRAHTRCEAFAGKRVQATRRSNKWPQVIVRCPFACSGAAQPVTRVPGLTASRARVARRVGRWRSLHLSGSRAASRSLATPRATHVSSARYGRAACGPSRGRARELGRERGALNLEGRGRAAALAPERLSAAGAHALPLRPRSPRSSEDRIDATREARSWTQVQRDEGGGAPPQLLSAELSV